MTKSNTPTTPRTALPSSSSSLRTTVLAVHANVFLYAAAYWLTTPLIPYLLKELGARSLSLGVFQSLFNVVQLSGGLVIGVLQDRYSGAVALSITQLGSALVYGCLYLSTASLTMMYLSRLPTALQQAMQVAQAVLSKSAGDPETRSVSIARLSMSYAGGMVVGSMSSGFIADAVGMRANALLAVALSLAAVVINWAFLPTVDIHAAAKEKTDKTSTSKSGLGSYIELAVTLQRVFIFLGCLYAARGMFEPVNNLTLVNTFDLSKTNNGKLTSVLAALAAIANVFVLPFLLRTAKIPERRVNQALIATLAVVYLAIAVVPMDVTVYIGCLGVAACAAAMLYTTCTSFAVATVPEHTHGRVIAMTHALRSALGIVTPLAATYLYESQGAATVFLMCCGLVSLSIVTM